MGWTQRLNSTLKQVIEECTEEFPNHKVIAKCFRGAPTHSGVLWAVWEGKKDGVETRFIVCYLLEYWRKGGQGWAIKEIDESMGPCACNCPMKYIELVKKFKQNGYSDSWRERVIEFHKAKKEKRRERAVKE